jgi:hypothetical protein
MADGPVANLPAGFDAYAGYVNDSGIGPTYPFVVARFPTALHLAITTDGSPAECADVESGAMKSWIGYDWGYCAVSNVNALIGAYARPKKLWTAHHNERAHICSPACWPGLVTTADGTQWTDHGGSYDESLLLGDFFDLAPQPQEAIDVTSWTVGGQNHVAGVVNGVAYHWWQATGGNPAPAPKWYFEVLPT